jgi:ribosomal protein S12 methylthiotransferase
MAKRRNEETAAEERPPLVGMVSLGCAKNTVDSERLLGMLAERGFVPSADPDAADVVVINTCAFIAPARAETERTLRSLGRRRPVIALGCFPGRLGRNGARPVFRKKDFPEVDAFVAFDGYDRLPELCARLAGVERLRGGGVTAARRERATGPSERLRQRTTVASLEPPLARPCFADAPRLRLGSPASAYLKVAEGCSNRCRYCAVPSIRGPLCSVPVERAIEEAKALARLGAKELCVIAQDTAVYGVDLYGKPRLAELLRRLCDLDGPRWIRLMYVHPAHLTDDVIEVVAGEPKMCRYLDLPIQHAADRVLAAMGRGYDSALLRSVVERLRDRVPGIALRTSVIVGFPGETAGEFRELLDFVRETRFEHLGAFVYSPERGTPAARLGRRVSASTARGRRRRLMLAQQEIAFEALDSRVGGTETALLELPAGGASGGVFLARTEREAPEVDGHVEVRVRGRPLRARPGDFVRVMIAERSGYDLKGVAL